MLKYASVSNAGGRKCNEDFVKITTVGSRSCFVVCDGLGGHEKGEVAAQMTGNTLIDAVYFSEDITCFLEDAFALAQKNLRQYQAEKAVKGDMKTTAVCVVSDETTLYVGHVGDSRFYGFKRDGSYIRTRDHSIPQLLVQSGTIDEGEIRHHPSRNMLLKAIGDKTSEPLCELMAPLPLQDYSALLLCTDGFWEHIDEQQMLAALSDSLTAKEWLAKMLVYVEAGGVQREMDNYSAIAIFCET